jgi:hypothetical protein
MALMAHTFPRPYGNRGRVDKELILVAVAPPVDHLQ